MILIVTIVVIILVSFIIVVIKAWKDGKAEYNSFYKSPTTEKALSVAEAKALAEKAAKDQLNASLKSPASLEIELWDFNEGFSMNSRVLNFNVHFKYSAVNLFNVRLQGSGIYEIDVNIYTKEIRLEVVSFH